MYRPAPDLLIRKAVSVPSAVEVQKVEPLVKVPILQLESLPGQIGTGQRESINALIITLSLRAAFGQVRHIKQTTLLDLIAGVKVLVSIIGQKAEIIAYFATSILPPLQKAPRNVRLFFIGAFLSQSLKVSCLFHGF